MDMETKQQKRLPVGIQTFSAYWHNMKHWRGGAHTHWPCGHGVRTDKALYLFELKINKSAAAAMKQIDLKDYPARFAMCGLPIVKVGINFDADKRTIGDWKLTS